jgi:hypothetical protein
MRIACALLALVLLLFAGCNRQPDFAEWHEELAYLRSQANTTPSQFKRLQELAQKARDEERAAALKARDEERAAALAEEARDRQVEEEYADGRFREAEALEKKDPQEAMATYDFVVKYYPRSSRVEEAKARSTALAQRIVEEVRKRQAE